MKYKKVAALFEMKEEELKEILVAFEELKKKFDNDIKITAFINKLIGHKLSDGGILLIERIAGHIQHG